MKPLSEQTPTETLYKVVPQDVVRQIRRELRDSMSADIRREVKKLNAEPLSSSDIEIGFRNGLVKAHNLIEEKVFIDMPQMYKVAQVPSLHQHNQGEKTDE